MDVTVKTEKTFVVSMTESQAVNMLRLSRAIDGVILQEEIGLTGNDRTGTLETLSDLRQALLASGITLKDPQ
jgi:hypothetical protein